MALIGDSDRSLDLLESIIGTVQSESLVWIKIDTSLDNVRHLPRFKAMIAATEARLAAAK